MLCEEKYEAVNHIISEYSKFAQKKYKAMYNWGGKVVSKESCEMHTKLNICALIKQATSTR